MNWNAEPITVGIDPLCQHLLHLDPAWGPMMRLTCAKCRGFIYGPMSLRDGESTWNDVIQRLATHIKGTVCEENHYPGQPCSLNSTESKENAISE